MNSKTLLMIPAQAHEFMLVNYKNHLQLPENCFELDMGGYPIARTNCYEYLGILFDDKLSWEPHISELCKKLSQIAGVIFKKTQSSI